MIITPATGSREQALRHGHNLLNNDPTRALEQAREMLRINQQDADAHRLEAKALRRLGEADDAAAAELAAINASASIPAIGRAVQFIRAGRLAEAENVLRERLRAEPEDAAALRMLADLALRSGFLEPAADLLRQALALAPGFGEARFVLASVLADMQDIDGELEQLETLVKDEPDNPQWRSRLAGTLTRLDRYEDALAEYDAMIAKNMDEPIAWIGRGHVLKTLGRAEDSRNSYRRATEIDPARGEAWWSIANLKSGLLTSDDIAVMEGQRARQDDERSRVNLLFALGSAKEKNGDFAGSFADYAEANRRWRALIGYNPDWVLQRCNDIRQSIDAKLVKKLAPGLAGTGPVFVLGMPRAGSTLVDQMLSSHSRVEGTAELPYMPALALDLLRRTRGEGTLGAMLAAMSAEDLARAGQFYMDKAARHRQEGAPLFIDKTPNNWLFVPIILAALPDARIVDVRRAPMACCFSNFKQHFARGQAFTYDLQDVGTYYAAYVETMAHLDRVFPGRIHRVSYERLIGDSEAEMRAALSYLGLDFEPGVLDFHSSQRAVRTASAEQVRRPIQSGSNDQWKPFAPWLDPLRDALGPLAELDEAPA